MQFIRHSGTTADSWYKARLNALIEEVFGFSFHEWHKLGVWGDDYHCFTLIDRDHAVANLSAYEMRLQVQDAEVSSVQLGAMAVKPENRGHGLARRLMEHVGEVYHERPMFLFGGDNVREFYPKFGFQPEADRQPVLALQSPGEADTGTTALPVKEPHVVDRYLKERQMFSRMVDCTNQYAVNWFHVLSEHLENAYVIPDLDVLVVVSLTGDTLTIHDVVAKGPLHWDELERRLPFRSGPVQQIRFGCNPDWLEAPYELVDHAVEDSTLFVRDGLADLPGIIPQLIRT